LIDREKIRAAVASIIEAIGEDPSREGLVDTPARVARMYEELFSGLDRDPAEVLSTGFDEGLEDLVVLKDIPFFQVEGKK
jgi:GTP cyclohydrolase I